MNGNQEVFRRIEKKYIVDEPTYEKLIKKLDGHFVKDRYYKSTICNIYYDTPSHQLVRNSIEKPVYKEKLRVRSYGVPNDEDMVFVELKKKYKGVVYKRRIEMTLAQTRDFFAGKDVPHDNPQIENELKYFLKFYEGIAPAMYLSYDRLAYCGAEDPSLRPAGMRVMEIKIPNAMPLWLSAILDELEIYPASFSKYGTAYLNEFSEKIHKGKVISCA